MVSNAYFSDFANNDSFQDEQLFTKQSSVSLSKPVKSATVKLVKQLQFTSVYFSSVKDGIYALGNDHMRSAPNYH